MRGLAKAELCNWQLPYSLAGCSEDRVAEGRNERRHPRLTHTRWRSIAIDHVHVGLGGHFTNSSHRIILKIRLVDHALGSRNFPASCDAGAEDSGALELSAGRFRFYHQAGI